jgi:hypothetical protein
LGCGKFKNDFFFALKKLAFRTHVQDKSQSLINRQFINIFSEAKRSPSFKAKK